MNAYTMRVTGMTCDHCARTVEEALGRLPGVTSVHVSYAGGTAHVETRDGVPESLLLRAVAATGYGVEPLEARGSSGSGPTG